MQARKSVFVEAYNHDISDLHTPAKSLIAQVVIDGWWKLIIPGPATPDRKFATVPPGIALFNLEADPLEENNIAGEYPEIVERLRALQEKEWSP